MDKIYIKDLEVYAYHGVNQQEKDMGQKFLISLELALNLREAGISDDINKTVNYAELCQRVEIEFKKNKYALIEMAAEETAKFILLNYDRVDHVDITIKKPWAPIGKPIDFAAVHLERGWHRVYLGLGSNIGDKKSNLEEAIKLINASENCNVIRVSQFYETKPVGYEDQDNFMNAAVCVKTLLEPDELMEFLLSIEKELKRERVIRWGPRTIDIDILLYDEIITESENVIIPHPRMQDRLFVLKPLSDIAPYKIHPILKRRIIDIEQELSKTDELL